MNNEFIALVCVAETLHVCVSVVQYSFSVRLGQKHLSFLVRGCNKFLCFVLCTSDCAWVHKFLKRNNSIHDKTRTHYHQISLHNCLFIQHKINLVPHFKYFRIFGAKYMHTGIFKEDRIIRVNNI